MLDWLASLRAGYQPIPAHLSGAYPPAPPDPLDPKPLAEEPDPLHGLGRLLDLALAEDPGGGRCELRSISLSSPADSEEGLQPLFDRPLVHLQTLRIISQGPVPASWQHLSSLRSLELRCSSPLHPIDLNSALGSLPNPSRLLSLQIDVARLQLAALDTVDLDQDSPEAIRARWPAFRRLTGLKSLSVVLSRDSFPVGCLEVPDLTALTLLDSETSLSTTSAEAVSRMPMLARLAISRLPHEPGQLLSRLSRSLTSLSLLTLNREDHVAAIRSLQLEELSIAFTPLEFDVPRLNHGPLVAGLSSLRMMGTSLEGLPQPLTSLTRLAITAPYMARLSASQLPHLRHLHIHNPSRHPREIFGQGGRLSSVRRLGLDLQCDERDMVDYSGFRTADLEDLVHFLRALPGILWLHIRIDMPGSGPHNVREIAEVRHIPLLA